MELIKLGEKTYYIKNNTNIGVYRTDGNNVWLIDTGNDKDAGRKILKIINEQGWTVQGIINTHSNADHIGGNKFIQDRTGCKILTCKIEKDFAQHTVLEPSFLYGGYPFKEIKNKFLMAKESDVAEIEDNLPEGLEYFSLKGHFFDMIGVRTSDDIYFLADSLFSEDTINKYHLFFIYDVREYLSTLDYLDTLNGKIFVPSHCNAAEDITSLTELNRKKINEISDKIYDFCSAAHTFEEILKYIFDAYNLVMNPNQYVLIGSTVRSYLSYLKDENKISFEFRDNRMLWKQGE